MNKSYQELSTRLRNYYGHVRVANRGDVRVANRTDYR